uniref:Uncharacterized protein n=1 Tax=viral metagenome TaxID=1070528 RepID=A0A6H1ZPB2_9ZZZZ
MKTVRAKFKCDSVSPEFDGGSKIIKFSAVTEGSEENKSFWKYTPAGSLEMQIDNPPASSFFKLGKEYYLDFIEVD